MSLVNEINNSFEYLKNTVGINVINNTVIKNSIKDQLNDDFNNLNNKYSRLKDNFSYYNIQNSLNEVNRELSSKNNFYKNYKKSTKLIKICNDIKDSISIFIDEVDSDTNDFKEDKSISNLSTNININNNHSNTNTIVKNINSSLLNILKLNIFYKIANQGFNIIFSIINDVKSKINIFIKLSSNKVRILQQFLNNLRVSPKKNRAKISSTNKLYNQTRFSSEQLNELKNKFDVIITEMEQTQGEIERYNIEILNKFSEKFINFNNNYMAKISSYTEIKGNKTLDKLLKDINNKNKYLNDEIPILKQLYLNSNINIIDFLEENINSLNENVNNIFSNIISSGRPNKNTIIDMHKLAELIPNMGIKTHINQNLASRKNEYRTKLNESIIAQKFNNSNNLNTKIEKLLRKKTLLNNSNGVPGVENYVRNQKQSMTNNALFIQKNMQNKLTKIHTILGRIGNLLNFKGNNSRSFGNPSSIPVESATISSPISAPISSSSNNSGESSTISGASNNSSTRAVNESMLKDPSIVNMSSVTYDNEDEHFRHEGNVVFQIKGERNYRKGKVILNNGGETLAVQYNSGRSINTSPINLIVNGSMKKIKIPEPIVGVAGLSYNAGEPETISGAVEFKAESSNESQRDPSILNTSLYNVEYLNATKLTSKYNNGSKIIFRLPNDDHKIIRIGIKSDKNVKYNSVNGERTIPLESVYLLGNAIKRNGYNFLHNIINNLQIGQKVSFKKSNGSVIQDAIINMRPNLNKKEISVIYGQGKSKKTTVLNKSRLVKKL